MIRYIDIKVAPDKMEDVAFCHKKVVQKSGVDGNRIHHIMLDRRSIDARGKKVLYFLRYKVFIDEEYEHQEPRFSYVDTKTAKKKCLIVGAGPAGYFAALQLIEMGIQPIVLERGKDVRKRRVDLKAIQQEGIVNPDSNYCFGEGGAGTYSDGKLYTRSHKRGNIERVLQILVAHGAKSDILIDTHPHIGSNKLPQIVSAIRDTIEAHGGAVHFDCCVTDLVTHNQKVIGVTDQHGRMYKGDAVILATGHSARDIFSMLDEKGLRLEPKPFALGLRIEHPQTFVDGCQYNAKNRGPYLPAASYSLASQENGCGVFSFCMCPGGLIVPAATAPGEIVVNGMSLSRRDSPYANSGLVTAIELDELAAKGYEGKFGPLRFQQEVERTMFNSGDGSQKAPGQRVTDFVVGKSTIGSLSSSYIPGISNADLHDLLPDFVYKRLRMGILTFDKKMKGYCSDEAIVVGVESRTSSPVRIPRHEKTLMHPDLDGFFPCGEGAGYAGGILSAAMDGQNVAGAVKTYVL